jgi:hypothetical protein
MPEIDGIKKIDKKDLVKSRKIVLDSISEEIKKEQVIRQQAPIAPAVKTVSDIQPKKRIPRLFTLKKKKKAKQKVDLTQKKADKKSFDSIQKKHSDPVAPKQEKKVKIEKISQKDKALWQDEMNKLLLSDDDNKQAEQEKDELAETKPKTEDKPVKVFSLKKPIEASNTEDEEPKASSVISEQNSLEPEISTKEKAQVKADKAKAKQEKALQKAERKKKLAEEKAELKKQIKEKKAKIKADKAKAKQEKALQKAERKKKLAEAKARQKKEKKKKSFFAFWRLSQNKPGAKKAMGKKPSEQEKNIAVEPVEKTTEKKSYAEPKKSSKQERFHPRTQDKSVNEDDSFDFNLKTYKKYEAKAKNKKAELKKVKSKTRGKHWFFFGRKKNKDDLKKHELKKAPDLVHDEIIAHESIEKPSHKKKKSQKKKFSLEEKYHVLRMLIKTNSADARLYILTIFTIFITLYSFLLILTLKVGVDTSMFRKISRFLPIPAVISQNNIIEYYVYRDLETDFCRGICSVQGKKDFKIWLANQIILNKLYDRYNLSGKSEAEEELKGMIVFDAEVNQVGINRIRKVKNIIDSEGEFFRNAQKYGDQVGQFKIENVKSLVKDLNVDINKIENKKTSRIVYGPDGYYVFYIDRELDPEAVSYVFITAKTLEEYLVEELDGYRIWSLVE